MSVEIIVKYRPDGDSALDIRTLACQLASAHPDGQNPLETTEFNKLLDKVAQQAFDAGRKFKIEASHD